MKTLTIQFCELALRNADVLPCAERADIYDFASSILERAELKNLADAAAEAAKHLREAESAQLQFRNLLNN